MNVLICDGCNEYALLCEKKVLQAAQKYSIQIKTKVFDKASALLFDIESSLANINLIYLDIHMPEMNGLQIASSLRQLGYLGDIIFYSTSPDYAIEGYDVSALHYVVKNVTTNEKFERIFQRSYKRMQRREQELLVLTSAGESRCIPIRDIRYFEIRKRIITVYYGKDSFEFYSTMMRIEEQLFGKGFIRNHKSFLVNTQWVRSVDRTTVVLDTGVSLPIGVKHYKNVQETIGS